MAVADLDPDDAVGVGLLGGVAGVCLSALLLFPFAQLIESALQLPYLMPDMKSIV